MTTATDHTIDMAEARAKRLQDIAEGYEVIDEGMPDSTVPGAAKVETSHDGKIIRKHPRYVLVTQYGDKGNYRLRLGADKPNIEQLAADAVTDAYGAEMVICYFDLDVLAGEEPEADAYDKVSLLPEAAGHYGAENQERVFVVYDIDSKDDRRTLDLSVAEDEDPLFWCYADEVVVLERSVPDERMPVRYGLARIITQVVFNTIPSP
jgi:hypothetical protein